MDMSLFVQQDIVRFHVTMDDALGMNVPQGTAQFGDPKAHCVLGETFAGDVEAKITAIHEIDDNITWGIYQHTTEATEEDDTTYMYSMS